MRLKYLPAVAFALSSFVSGSLIAQQGPPPPPPSEKGSVSAMVTEAKPAEPKVAAANQAVLSQLPFSDRQDFEDAKRGFIATTPDAANPDRWAFLEHEAPPTVNPSLWRQAQLNAANGLFKVTAGVYQVRGFSQANMTIVEGTTGLIVIDTLTTPGAAREALNLYFAHRPRKPGGAVIYSDT